MIKRQLWSSGHRNDKPDKWVEDSSSEAEKPECQETKMNEISRGVMDDIQLLDTNS